MPIPLITLSRLSGKEQDIKTLSLNNTAINDDDLATLQEALKENTQLETLDLSNNCITAKGIVSIQAILSNSGLPLKTLILSGNKLDTQSILQLFNTLKSNTRLQKLHLDCCLQAQGSRWAWINPMSYLSISSEADDLQFFSFLSSNTTLLTLSVKNNNLNKIQLQSLANGLANNQVLKNLNVSENAIDDASMDIFAVGISKNTSLEYFNLSQNQIKNTGLQFLAIAILRKACNIERLNLAGNNIGDEGAIIIANIINQSEKIISINICDNEITHQGLKTICDALRLNNTLVELEINAPHNSYFEAKIMENKTSREKQLKIKDADVWFMQARESFAKERYFEAINFCQQALNILPKHLEANLYAAQAYDKTDQLDQAIKAYKEFLALSPLDNFANERYTILSHRKVALLLSQAQKLANIGQYFDVIRECREALTLVPTAVEVHLLLAKTYDRLEDRKNTIRAFEMYLSYREDIQARARLCDLTQKQQQEDQEKAKQEEHKRKLELKKEQDRAQQEELDRKLKHEREQEIIRLQKLEEARKIEEKRLKDERDELRRQEKAKEEEIKKQEKYRIWLTKVPENVALTVITNVVKTLKANFKTTELKTNLTDIIIARIVFSGILEENFSAEDQAFLITHLVETLQGKVLECKKTNRYSFHKKTELVITSKFGKVTIDNEQIIKHIDDAINDAKGNKAVRLTNESVMPLPSAPPDTDPPENLLCPISHELYKNPVLAGDWHTYSRSSIEDWFKTEKTSPVSRQDLKNTDLIPNQHVKTEVINWLENHPDYLNENPEYAECYPSLKNKLTATTTKKADSTDKKKDSKEKKHDLSNNNYQPVGLTR